MSGLGGKISYVEGAEPISHPDCYLWDSWCYSAAGLIHLYALAVERRDANGVLLAPGDRNSRPFHFHRFTSGNGGKSWSDAGCFLRHRGDGKSFDARSVWSGSISRAQDGTALVGYTGIAEYGDQRPFVQSMAVVRSRDGQRPDLLPEQPLCCPMRDRREILDAGYYLGPAESLGDKDGEGGGPILCWRDPYLWLDGQGRWHMFWAAKSSPRQGVVGHALLRESDGGFHIERLYPPISLGDNDYTQIELPKVYHDAGRGLYYMLVATCNRISESQPGSEVQRRSRLYRSPRLEDGWEPCYADDGAIDGEAMYGLSVLEEQFSQGRLLCIAPLDERAGERALTLGPSFYLELP